ncbi:MAG: hypothetical protein PVG78_16685 [Desulfobacterales bacterium]|jgi:hypothetical protein
METCTFSDFMETLKPWLSSDYIHRAKMDDQGRFVLLFSDGGQRVFQIDGCTRPQMEDIVEKMKQNGIRVEP